MMTCEQFEHLMSEYLEGSAEPAAAEAFVHHYLSCEPCRQLFDDVRATVDLCHRLEAVEPRPYLQNRILEATTAGAMMSCAAFDELLADYFDGFLPAEEYHLFETHFEQCQRCQRLLRSVETVRDLCRQLEPVAVPEGLTERILDATIRADHQMQPLARWITLSWMWLKHSLRRTLGPLLTPELVTASILFLATLGFLLVDLSDDRSLSGIYRGASQRTARMLNPSESDGNRMLRQIQKLRADVSGWIEAGVGFFTGERESKAIQGGDQKQ